MKRADDRKAEDGRGHRAARRDGRRCPGLTYDYEVPSLFRFQTPIEVEIYAYDLDTLRAAGADRGRASWTRMPGADRRREPRCGSAIPRCRSRSIATGWPPCTWTRCRRSRLVRNAVQGEAATQFNDLERKIDVRVRATEDERSMVAELAQLEVGRNQGTVVPLGAVADVRVARGPGEIRRIGQQRAAVVTANLQGRDLASAARRHRGGRWRAWTCRRASRSRWPARTASWRESFGSLRFALLLAVFLVYLVMASQFESLLHPFVIMFTMPIGVIGVVLALVAHRHLGQRHGADRPGGAGRDRGQQRASCWSTTPTRAARRRAAPSSTRWSRPARSALRPILMTTLTTVLGLVPMAIATGEGAELRASAGDHPDRRAHCSATVLTLVVMPAVYATLGPLVVNLPRWSLRYPITASMVIVCMLVMGAVSATRLPLAFLPEVDFPGLEINIPYPNALPAQVEEEITRPAEEALATLSRVRRINSWSSANSANIYVQFDWGEDIEPLRVEAREKLERIRDRAAGRRRPDPRQQLPLVGHSGARVPDLGRPRPVARLRAAQPPHRRPAAPRSGRGQGRAVRRRSARSADRCSAWTRSAATGSRPGTWSRSSTPPTAASMPASCVGATRSGRCGSSTSSAASRRSKSFPINDQGLRLGDVATVAYAEPDLDYGRHLDDTRAIGLNVIKESGANTVAVASRARKVLATMKDDPALEGIQVLTFTDQAEQIRNSIHGLLEAGIIGALLATGVLFFFLRRLAATLVVALTIPVSLLAAAALMFFTGRTLNILSMMGLMLAVGMLVDNAVVVLESIERLRIEGMGRMRAALRGSREVLPAVISSTMTSMIVFLPLVLGGAHRDLDLDRRGRAHHHLHAALLVVPVA